MDQFQNGDNFTVVKNSPIVGGHCMPILKADTKSMDTITWSKGVKAVNAWIKKYMDECYVVISKDYFNGTKTAEGFDIAALIADLALVSK